MIECGCCHMYMGEMEEALRLWNQIEQIIREPPIDTAFAEYLTSEAKCINTIKKKSPEKEINDKFYFLRIITRA